MRMVGGVGGASRGRVQMAKTRKRMRGPPSQKKKIKVKKTKKMLSKNKTKTGADVLPLF